MQSDGCDDRGGTHSQRTLVEPRPAQSRVAGGTTASPSTRWPRPRDYAVDPSMFGQAATMSWAMPEHGNDAGLAVARAQHELAWIIRHRCGRGASTDIARRAGISRRTMSDYTLGKSWMSRVAFAAAAAELTANLDHRG